MKQFLIHYLFIIMLSGFCQADEFHPTDIQKPSVELFLTGDQQASIQYVTFCDSYKHHNDAFSSSSLHNYTADQLQYYFNHRQCDEEEILHQPVLYLSNEFVKFAKRYAGYELAIEKLHKKFTKFGLLKKILHTFTGTYSPGLKERISRLYREIQLKKLSHNKNPHKSIQKNPTNQRNQQYFLSDAQITEYEQLKPVYEQYCPSLAKAIVQRMIAHKSGNQLQYVLHQESVAILEKTQSLSFSDVLYPHKKALISCALAVDDYSSGGFIDKATCIADFCWTLFDYGKAIAEGAALGIYTAAQDLIEHPIEATVCMVAGKQVLVYQLCKVLYNVADIGLTAITDYDHAKEKWDDYIKPLSNIIAAIENKEIALRDVLKAGTALVVGYKAQSKLLAGLGMFCRTIKQKAVRFAQNNPLCAPQDYLITPDGMLLKATNQVKKSFERTSSSNLQKTIEDKIIKKQSIKGLIKEKKLPTKGKIRYVPPKKFHVSDGLPTVPLPNGSAGFVDRFGNVWTEGRSVTKGQDFEWDVQLSKQGIRQVGWMTRDNSHLNVSLDGKVTHK